MKKHVLFHHLIIPLCRRPYVLILFLSLVGTSGCYKETPPPVKYDPCPWPEVTTEGLNTFGCKINGVEWVPCVDLNGAIATLRPIDCLVSESNGSNSISIVMTRSVKDSTYSEVNLNGQFFMYFSSCEQGVHDIPSQFFQTSLSVFTDWDGQFYDKLNTTSNNYIEIIKIDTTANHVSGRFQFKLENSQNTETIEITDGRFDLTYYPQ